MENKKVIDHHKHILGQARRNKETLYGARAMNKQLSWKWLSRPTFDYDIYSKKPRKSARQLEKTLDRASNQDIYYVKPAMHKGTFKVMHKGYDKIKGTKDDYGIADYTKPQRKIKSIKQNKIRYAHISERVKDAKTSLKNPMFKFRHKKDKSDLERIKKSRWLQKHLFGGI